MVIESEHLVEHNSYTAEEIAGTILQIAIKLNYIKRENLTANGEMFLSEAEKHKPDDD